MLQLFTDTDTDITPERAAEYGYKLISMPYVVNGEEIYPYVSFTSFDSRSFYDMLRRGTLPSTCGLSPAAYIEYFEPVLKAGNDILYVHFSEAMSGTFNAMRLAIAELKSKYPERSVYTIDTKGITICSYNIVCAIGKLYKKGMSAAELLEWAKAEVDKFAIYFYADDLKFFGRSGRVGGLTATMGNLFGIRPIISMNSAGVMDSVAKGKGRRGTLAKIMEYVRSLQEDISEHRVVVGHTDAPELAAELVAELKKEFGDGLDVETVVVNPTAGSHCGPDGVGVCFHAKHR